MSNLHIFSKNSDLFLKLGDHLLNATSHNEMRRLE